MGARGRPHGKPAHDGADPGRRGSSAARAGTRLGGAPLRQGWQRRFSGGTWALPVVARIIKICLANHLQLGLRWGRTLSVPPGEMAGGDMASFAAGTKHV